MLRLCATTTSVLLLCTAAWASYLPESPNGCRPPKFQRGFYTPRAGNKVSRFPVGTKLTFRCSLEYELIGSQYARCLPNGRWKTLPQCLDGCRPQDVPHGTVSPLPSNKLQYYNYRDVIRVTCDYGYIQLGNAEATCSKGGQWTSYLQCVAGCTAPKVPRLVTLPRLVEGANVYKVDTVVRCRCEKGYYIRGAHEIKCVGNEKWNVELPTCDKIVFCKYPKELKMGSYRPFQKQYGVGDKVTWSCNNGNRMRGAKVSVCKEDGLFRPPKPTCEPYSGGTDYKPSRPGSYYIKKGACYAPSLSHGVIITPKRPFYKLAVEVKYSCEPGYRMVGSAASVCGRKGFREDPPVCQPITCAAPDLPQYAQFVESPKEEYFYGDKVCYICDQSYTMIGSECTSCGANGQFSKTPPTCRPESCRFDCKRKPGRSCQCDTYCKHNGNCCGDFANFCRWLFY